MNDEDLAAMVRAYEEWFGPPVSVVRPSSGSRHVGVVVRPPGEDERADDEANLTLLGTAGLGPARICHGEEYEVCVEVAGVLDEDAIGPNATALLELALAPISTGRPFEINQILTNLQLPAFPKFTAAMLVDWDPVDGFRFPRPCEGIGLLRVLPLFQSEVEHVESFADRSTAYLSLFNKGMQERDPDREAVV